MKQLSILVPEGDCSLSNIEGTHQIFSKVNYCLLQSGRPALFQIQLVGLNKQSCLKKGFFRIVPDAVIDEVTHSDLVIIPAIQEADMRKALEMNRGFVPWIIERHKQGAAVASLCIGSFLLASTGLLSGKKCATHWIAAEEFRNMFPDVQLVTDKIITDEQGIYSSGGAYSSLNLILYLVEKFAGREMAILCSKIFQIELERNNQSGFMIFNPQKDHEDDCIKQAQEYIERNVTDRISVEELALRFAIGRRNFERRFKKATNNTPVEYIQRVKIEAAKKSLELSRKNVNEVMYDVGYSDTKAFRTIFKRVTGLSPIDYRNRYNRELAMI
ncbi:MAG TPA: helix-turn-helix domain-containing protein [Puia sp.]|nr:helix-turn-helix domain-containing protein [Puia sp.]